MITVCCAEVLLQKYTNQGGFINCLLQGIMIFCKGSSSHELVINTVLPFRFLVSTEEFIKTQNTSECRHQTQSHGSIQPYWKDSEPFFRSERMHCLPRGLLPCEQQMYSEIRSPRPACLAKQSCAPGAPPPCTPGSRGRGGRSAPSPAKLRAQDVT